MSGRGKESLFSGYGVSVLQDEKVLEIYRTHVHVVNTAVHIKMAKNLNFMLCALYHICEKLSENDVLYEVPATLLARASPMW